MLGQVVAGEVGARRLLRAVLGGQPAQHTLQDGQRRLGRRQLVERLRRGGPFVGSGVAVDRSPLQAGEVVVPPLGVHRRLLLGQALVGQRDLGASGDRLEQDRHGRGVGSEVDRALPAPPEDDTSAGLDLAEGAGRNVTGGDGPAVVTADPQVDAGRHCLPAAQPLGLGDEGEGLVDVDGQDNGLGEHQWSLSIRWDFTVCASVTSRSSSAVQIRSARRAAGRARRPPR